MTVPCRECPDRQEACHGSCERYREYRAEMEARYPERRTKAIVREIRSARVEATMRSLILHRKRRGM